jgi:CHAT domain-containing protein
MRLNPKNIAAFFWLLALLLVLALPRSGAAQTFYYHEIGEAQKQAQSGDIQGAADRMRALLQAFQDEGRTDKWMLSDIYLNAVYFVGGSGDTAGALALIEQSFQDGEIVKNLPQMFEVQGYLYLRIGAYLSAGTSFSLAADYMQMGSFAKNFTPERVAKVQLEAVSARVRSDLFAGDLEQALGQAREALRVLGEAGQSGAWLDYYLPRMRDVAGDLFRARDAYLKLLDGAGQVAPDILRNVALIDWQLGDYDIAGRRAEASLSGLEATGGAPIELFLMESIQALAPILSGQTSIDLAQSETLVKNLVSRAEQLDKTNPAQMIWFLHWVDVVLTYLTETSMHGHDWVAQLDMSLFDYDSFPQDALARRVVTRIRLKAALALERLGKPDQALTLYTSVWLNNVNSSRVTAEAQAGRARTGTFSYWEKQSIALAGAQAARHLVENVPARLGRSARQQQARFAQLFELAFEANYTQLEKDPPLRWVKAEYGRVPEPQAVTFVFPWKKSEEFFSTADGLVTGDLLSEAFDLLQLARQSEAGRAIAAMTSRLAAGSGELAQLLRERDEILAKREIATDGEMGNLTGLDAQLDQIETRLDAEFPAYRQASGIDPLSLVEARDLLAPREAMAVMLAREEGLYTFLVTPEYVGWHRSGVTRDWLESRVSKLRLALDPTEAARSGVALNKRAKARQFDLDVAHAVWQQTLGPLAPYLPPEATVFLVPDGALQSLPFSMLLTDAPTARSASDHAAQPWAIKQFSFATLPVPASLRALRQAKPIQVPSVPFVGVGDPVLGGHSAADTRDVLSDAGALAALAPLPETERELQELNRLIAAGAGRLYLRDAAREPVLKSGALAEAQVLAFATHGLMGGELDGIAEPALVLTPPDRGSADEDGLLTASEIAQLRLNADWVLLSACNTAVGAGGGEAEGLSGLARAFFYAGARRLLVSHWSVQSDPTVALTTGMFRAKSLVGDDPTGARALRHSILDMIANPARSGWSHPAAWAPFVTVGG